MEIAERSEHDDVKAIEAQKTSPRSSPTQRRPAGTPAQHTTELRESSLTHKPEAIA